MAELQAKVAEHEQQITDLNQKIEEAQQAAAAAATSNTSEEGAVGGAPPPPPPGPPPPPPPPAGKNDSGVLNYRICMTLFMLLLYNYL